MKRMLLLTNMIVFFLTISVFPQLSGNYTVGAGGSYDSLGAAIVALNTNGVNGPVKMLLLEGTHNIGANLWLGCNGTNSNNTITFKPNANATVVLNFLSDAASNIDGNFVIGSPTGTSANLVSTNYIIIDGSNTEGGTTKDLTINGVSTATQRSVIRIFGDNNNITVKNCIIVSRSSNSGTTAPIMITNYNASSVNYTPDNITVENNTLTSNSGNGGQGVNLSVSGTPSVGMTNIVINRNAITARATRAIMCNYVNDAIISNNTISQDIQLSTAAAATIWLSTGTSAAGSFDIYGNQITYLRTWNNVAGPTASNGIIGIDNQLATPKIVRIYNNFIAGFTTQSSSVQGVKIYGIRHANSSTSYVYNNTIHIPELTNMTNELGSYISGIAFATAAVTEASPTGTMILKNNIVVVNETSMKVYAIRRVGNGGVFYSNHNNLYVNSSNTSGSIGLFDATDLASITDWKTTSTRDTNSISKSVVTSSTTDLHLSGASIGDVELTGTPVALVTTDIDGEARNATYPYMGADEASTPLPVELSSLNAAVSGTSVTLKWTTATEVNSYQFQIEQRSLGTEWSTVSSVLASGNSNSPKNYRYTVESLTSGKYQFRLKMIDADGSFEYSEPVVVEISTPVQFRLSQNYPNPFNPTTTLNYALPFQGNVKLLVYSTNGELVKTLVSEVQAAGSYSVTFDASKLASGTYIYRLTATDAAGINFTDTKKMLLMK